MNTKWIMNLYVEARSAKLSRENIGINHHDLGLYLNINPGPPSLGYS